MQNCFPWMPHHFAFPSVTMSVLASVCQDPLKTASACVDILGYRQKNSAKLRSFFHRLGVVCTASQMPDAMQAEGDKLFPTPGHCHRGAQLLCDMACSGTLAVNNALL